MSNIDKQALRGQSVEGSFYLAECGYCGQVMPSSKLRVLHSPDGEADCYCPHCNAEGCEIFDLGTVGSEVVNAWNYQQKRIEALLDELEAVEKRIAELESDNAYIRNRHKELDLLIGKNILVMQAAIIEWQGTGDARKGLAWIYNTLFGPGELPDESEKDAQAYFDRKYAPLDEEIMNLHRWFWEQSEAERAAAAGKGE